MSSPTQHRARSDPQHHAHAHVGRVAPLATAALDEELCFLAINKEAKFEGQWRLMAAIVICTLFMIGEVAGGIIAHSLAILTDAAHMLSDVSAFAISLFAGLYALRESRQSHTYGYHRVEVLGSLVSVLIIWVVTGVLLYEAVLRVLHPEPVDGRLMFFLALAGIAVNLAVLFLFGHSHGHSHGGHSHDHGGHSHGGHSCGGHTAGEVAGHSHGADVHNHEGHGHAANDECSDHGHDEEAGLTPDDVADAAVGGAGERMGHSAESLGMRAAFIHALGDTVQSLGVCVAGILIWVKPEWSIADPICTFIFGILVLLTTRTVLRDITDVVMERVPREVDMPQLVADFKNIGGVDALHDLHVWCMKPGVVLLSMHVEVFPNADARVVLKAITARSRREGIEHTTVQVTESGAGCCITTPLLSEQTDVQV